MVQNLSLFCSFVYGATVNSAPKKKKKLKIPSIILCQCIVYNKQPHWRKFFLIVVILKGNCTGASNSFYILEHCAKMSAALGTDDRQSDHFIHCWWWIDIMPLPVWEIHRRNLVILQMVAALLLYCLLIHGLQNKQNKTAAVLC